MTNSLIHQSSPYLLQHAHNPVDWHPWEPPALALARQLDRPILLSIGYAACHWCHVMERESFENEATAQLMNDNFVCIKVDREERPDLDRIYQLTHQILTQRPGGWPLTVVLTPNGHAPYFAGTYFPPEPRFNMPGFPQLLEKLAAHYRDNRDKLQNQYHIFQQALSQLNPQPTKRNIPSPTELLRHAITTLGSQFDHTFGGFGAAPKFPHPTQLALLLADYRATGAPDSRSRAMAVLTLDRMAQGGLFDHLGGGFFRYSVDRRWEIPHFEKMLYDNAQLLWLYTEASTAFGNPRYRTTAEQTAIWLMREMQLENGGYAATLDADSEGEEGKYYVWDETDLRAVLSKQEYATVENYFNLAGEPNFEGHWHLTVNGDTDFAALANSPEIMARLDSATARLLELRDQRPRPGLDDKIIASWNGLAMMAMAIAARQFDRTDFLASARRAADCLRHHHWQGQRMLAVCTRGKSALNGYLDDYAFVLLGLLELLQTDWQPSYLDFALDIANAMRARFEDTEDGGFYFTSHDHEELLYRAKSCADDAIPSGNGAAVLGLLKLGALSGDSGYMESADRALQLFAHELEKQPSVNGLLTLAIQQLDADHATVIVRGNAQELDQWRAEIDRTDPNLALYLIPEQHQKLPPGLAVRRYPGYACAYLCRGMACTPPLKTPAELRQRLNSQESPD